MNERIEELSRIAKDWASDTMMEYNSNDSVEPIDFIFFYTKEFAELIVREMCQVMKAEGEQFSLDQNFDAVKGVGRCMRKVKEHFGVQE